MLSGFLVFPVPEAVFPGVRLHFQLQMRLNVGVCQESKCHLLHAGLSSCWGGDAGREGERTVSQRDPGLSSAVCSVRSHLPEGNRRASFKPAWIQYACVVAAHLCKAELRAKGRRRHFGGGLHHRAQQNWHKRRGTFMLSCHLQLFQWDPALSPCQGQPGQPGNLCPLHPRMCCPGQYF